MLGGCVCRAISHAAGLPFDQVREELLRRGGRGEHPEHPEHQIYDGTFVTYLYELGFVEIEGEIAWNDLPRDRAIVLDLRDPDSEDEAWHAAAVVDGVLIDYWDCRIWPIVRRFERENWSAIPD